METVSLEIGGELAERLKESAKALGITDRELILHVLLQYVEDVSDSDEEDDEEAEDEDEDAEGDESSADEED